MIIAIGLYYILALLLAKVNSSKLRIFTLIYLLILFCFNAGVADRETYELMYSMLDERFSSMEIVWSMTLLMMSKLGLGIQALYFIVGLPYLISLFYVIPRLSGNNNAAISCYMISMFFLDVVQLRFTLSATFLIWAFWYLCKKEGRKSIIGFLGFTLAASLIHSSNVVFFLFVLVKKLNVKQTFLVTLAACVAASAGMLFFANIVGELFNVESKVERISNAKGETGEHSIIIITIFCILIFVMAYLAMKYYRGSRQQKQKGEARPAELVLTYKFSIMALVFIPMLSLAQDFRRQIFLTFLLASSVVFSYSRKYSNHIVTSFPFIVALLYFAYSTFSGNRDTVFFPIFENNLIFGKL